MKVLQCMSNNDVGIAKGPDVSCYIRIKGHELKKEQERQEVKGAAEEIERLRDLHLWEQSMNERKKQEEKRSAMKAHQVRTTFTDRVNQMLF